MPVAKSQKASKSLAPVMMAEMVSGVKSLEVVATADNIAWLAATPELVRSARAASEFLFSALAINKESQLDKLLTENFDPEQIWQQIDLQATPILSMIKRSLRKLEKTPPGALVQSEEKAPKRKKSLRKIEKTPPGVMGRSEGKREHSEDIDGEGPSGSDDENDEDEDEDGSDEEDEVEEASKSEEEFSDYDEGSTSTSCWQIFS